MFSNTKYLYYKLIDIFISVFPVYYTILIFQVTLILLLPCYLTNKRLPYFSTESIVYIASFFVYGD